MNAMESIFIPEILSETEEQVLHFLLKNKTSNRYEISEKLGKSYSNVYNAIKNLLEKKMIEVAEKRAGKRNPNLHVKCYRATEKGARHALETLRLKFDSQLFSESEAFEGVPKDIEEMVVAIIKDYPNLFPQEFQNLSEKLACMLAVTHRGFPTYLSIIQAKLGLKAAEDPFIKKAVEAATDKDLKIMIKMAQNLAQKETQKLEEELQRKKQQTELLKKLNQQIPQQNP